MRHNCQYFRLINKKYYSKINVITNKKYGYNIKYYLVLNTVFLFFDRPKFAGRKVTRWLQTPCTKTCINTLPYETHVTRFIRQCNRVKYR